MGNEIKQGRDSQRKEGGGYIKCFLFINFDKIVLNDRISFHTGLSTTEKCVICNSELLCPLSQSLCFFRPCPCPEQSTLAFFGLLLLSRWHFAFFVGCSHFHFVLLPGKSRTNCRIRAGAATRDVDGQKHALHFYHATSFDSFALY